MKNKWQSELHRRLKKQAKRDKVPDAAPDQSVGLPKLVTAPQASEILAVSPRTLWGLTASGEIPHLRIGRCVRYSLDDLRNWIQQKKEGI
jgi:excisionase family DNA binding protein